MTAVSAPFGLRAVKHPSGQVRAVDMRLTKALADASPTMFLGTPVQIDATGRLALAANGSDWIGAFMGVEFQDLATGRPVVSNAWINGTLVKDNGNDSARFYFTRDPDIIYEIQTSQALAFDDIGEQMAFLNPTAGNTTTLLSTASADGSTVAAAQNMMSIVDIARYVDNDWTDAFPIVQVRVARHQDVALKAGY